MREYLSNSLASGAAIFLFKKSVTFAMAHHRSPRLTVRLSLTPLKHDGKHAYLSHLLRKHLIDQVCPQEILFCEKWGLSQLPPVWYH
jgi:hypothetical protein